MACDPPYAVFAIAQNCLEARLLLPSNRNFLIASASADCLFSVDDEATISGSGLGRSFVVSAALDSFADSCFGLTLSSFFSSVFASTGFSAAFPFSLSALAFEKASRNRCLTAPSGIAFHVIHSFALRSENSTECPTSCNRVARPLSLALFHALATLSPVPGPGDLSLLASASL